MMMQTTPQPQTQTLPSTVDTAMPGSILVNVGGALVLILMIIAVFAWLARRTGFARNHQNFFNL